MASTYKRLNAAGQEVHCVRWRQDGKQITEPFEGSDAELRAGRFLIDVKLAGEKWPPLWFPKIGYVSQAQWDALTGAAQPEPSPAATPHPLLEFCRERVSLLSGIQPRTRADYYRLIANYLDPFPAFKTADVADPDTFNEDHVAAWVNWLEGGDPDPEHEGAWLRAPKSPKTIANAHGLLYQLLERATRGEKPLRKVNPCADTNLPRLDDSTGEEMVFLTPADLAILWNAAGPMCRTVIEIAVGTAARFGEYTAFQAGDWDFSSAPVSVRVDRAWKRTNVATARDGRELGPPKTEKGRRAITIDPQTASTVQPLVEGKAPGEFILTDTRGRPLTHGRFYGPHWQPALYGAVRCAAHRDLDKAEGIMLKGERVRYTSRRQLSMEWIVPCGCPGTLKKIPRIHDLRHTAVAFLIAQNIPLKAIAKRLGHESTNTTDKTYGHLLPELDQKQADAMLAALAPLRLALVA